MRSARASALRLALWAGVAALVVLTGRTLAYALAPHPTLEAVRLGRVTGGPRLLVLTAVALGAAAFLAACVLGIATAAVRQRHLLAAGGSLRPPGPRLRPIFAQAAGLLTVTAAAFALTESWVHASAGLGHHGILCLTGPVHRDALPILAALSLFAAALVAAALHALVWLQRTMEALRRSRPPRPAQTVPGATPLAGFPVLRCRPLAFGSRAPPRLLEAA